MKRWELDIVYLTLLTCTAMRKILEMPLECCCLNTIWPGTTFLLRRNFVNIKCQCHLFIIINDLFSYQFLQLTIKPKLIMRNLCGRRWETFRLLTLICTCFIGRVITRRLHWRPWRPFVYQSNLRFRCQRLSSWLSTSLNIPSCCMESFVEVQERSPDPINRSLELRCKAFTRLEASEWRSSICKPSRVESKILWRETSKILQGQWHFTPGVLLSRIIQRLFSSYRSNRRCDRWKVEEVASAGFASLCASTRHRHHS